MESEMQILHFYLVGQIYQSDIISDLKLEQSISYLICHFTKMHCQVLLWHMQELAILTLLSWWICQQVDSC